MAWTVPSGHRYYDYSASRYYTAGQSVPAIGDRDWVDNVASTSATNQSITYTYYSTQLGGSWTALLSPKTSGMNISVALDTINGKEVRRVEVVDNYANNLRSITRFPVYMRQVDLSRCANLLSVPSFPQTTEYVSFYNCTSIKTIPSIPPTPSPSVGSSLVYFKGCSAIEGKIRIDAEPTLHWGEEFEGTTKKIVIYGNSSQLQTFADSSTGNVRVGRFIGDYLTHFVGTRGFIETLENKSSYSPLPTIAQINSTHSSAVVDVSCSNLFSGTNIETAPDIYSGIIDISNMFLNCAKLEGEILINSSGTYTGMFSGTVKDIYIRGSADLERISQTSALGNVHWGGFFNGFICTYNMGVAQLKAINKTLSQYTLPTQDEVEAYLGVAYADISLKECFEDCINLSRFPIIYQNVVDMTETFKGCVNLGGQIEINSTPTNYEDCFLGTQSIIFIGGTSLVLEQLAYTSPLGNVFVGEPPEWVEPVYNRTSPEDRCTHLDMTRIAGNTFLCGGSPRKLQYSQNDIGVTDLEWNEIVRFTQTIDHTIIVLSTWDNLNKIEKALYDVHNINNE